MNKELFISKFEGALTKSSAFTPAQIAIAIALARVGLADCDTTVTVSVGEPEVPLTPASIMEALPAVPQTLERDPSVYEKHPPVGFAVTGGISPGE